MRCHEAFTLVSCRQNHARLADSNAGTDRVYLYFVSEICRACCRAYTHLVAYIFHGIVDRRGFRIETNNFTVSTSTTRRVDINVAWFR